MDPMGIFDISVCSILVYFSCIFCCVSLKTTMKSSTTCPTCQADCIYKDCLWIPQQWFTSSWFQHHLKNMIVKLDHFTKGVKIKQKNLSNHQQVHIMPLSLHCHSPFNKKVDVSRGRNFIPKFWSTRSFSKSTLGIQAPNVRRWLWGV